MIVALLVLIVFVLLFGAGVVKGWLANAAAFAVGGGTMLMLALWLGSYLGEYGLIWVIVIVAALIGFAALIEDVLRCRQLDKISGQKQSGPYDHVPSEWMD